MCEKNNPFLTTYNKDYSPKKGIDKTTREINEFYKWKFVEYREPIAQPFKQFLCLDPCDKKDVFSEEIDTYYDKAIKTYPGFEYQTKNKPINKETVKYDRILDGRTEYQVDYCDLIKDNAEKEHARRTAVRLPLDIYIPPSTQRSSYRMPSSINSKAYMRDPLPRPKNNFDPNYKVREILKVNTGETEYGGIIGKLGDRIVVEHLHG